MRQVIMRSLDLGMASLRLLRAHPRLLVLPLLSLLSMAGILVGAMAAGVAAMIARDGGVDVPLGLLVACGLGACFAITLVLGFFSVAFTRAMMRVLREEQPSLRDALRFALGRLPALLGLSAVSTAVTALLGYRARVGASLLLGGSFASALVFPVMVQERRGALKSIRRSSALLKQTLRERVVAALGLGVVELIAALLASLPIGLGAWLFAQDLLVTPAIAAMILGVFGCVATGAVARGARLLYSIALYQIAVEGMEPADFGAPTLEAMWRVR